MTETWKDALGAFAAHLLELEKSPNTVKGYLSDLQLFAGWHAQALAEPPALDGLTPATLRDWKESMMKAKAAPQTVNRRLAAIQALVRFGESQGWCTFVRRPRSVRQETPRPRWLARREQLALVRAVEREAVKRDIALVKLLLHAGLRVEEAASVDRTMLELSPRKGQVTVVGKGRKRRAVPLNVEVRQALTDYLGKPNGKPANGASHVFAGRAGRLTANAMGRIIRRYGSLAKLDDVSPHVLRHTFCRRLAESGVRLEEIAALAGHESIETTRRYVEPGQDDLRAAVERLAGGED